MIHFMFFFLHLNESTTMATTVKREAHPEVSPVNSIGHGYINSEILVNFRRLRDFLFKFYLSVTILLLHCPLPRSSTHLCLASLGGHQLSLSRSLIFLSNTSIASGALCNVERQHQHPRWLQLHDPYGRLGVRNAAASTMLQADASLLPNRLQ